MRQKCSDTKYNTCYRTCKINGFKNVTEVAEILGYHPSYVAVKCRKNPNEFLKDLMMAKKIKRNNELRGIK